MELGLDSCQFGYFVDIIHIHQMTAPRMIRAWSEKLKVWPTPGPQRKYYVLTVLRR